MFFLAAIVVRVTLTLRTLPDRPKEIRYRDNNQEVKPHSFTRYFGPDYEFG